MRLFVLRNKETGLYARNQTSGFGPFEDAQLYRTPNPATSRSRYACNKDLPLEVVEVNLEEPA